MNTVFALVINVFLITGEPTEAVISLHDTEADCIAAAEEQKIPGDCYPVNKPVDLESGEIPAGL